MGEGGGRGGRIEEGVGLAAKTHQIQSQSNCVVKRFCTRITLQGHLLF